MKMMQASKVARRKRTNYNRHVQALSEKDIIFRAIVEKLQVVENLLQRPKDVVVKSRLQAEFVELQQSFGQWALFDQASHSYIIQFQNLCLLRCRFLKAYGSKEEVFRYMMQRIAEYQVAEETIRNRFAADLYIAAAYQFYDSRKYQKANQIASKGIRYALNKLEHLIKQKLPYQQLPSSICKAYFLLAKSYLKLEKYEKAITECEHSLHLKQRLRIEDSQESEKLRHFIEYMRIQNRFKGTAEKNKKQLQGYVVPDKRSNFLDPHILLIGATPPKKLKRKKSDVSINLQDNKSVQSVEIKIKLTQSSRVPNQHLQAKVKRNNFLKRQIKRPSSAKKDLYISRYPASSPNPLFHDSGFEMPRTLIRLSCQVKQLIEQEAKRDFQPEQQISRVQKQEIRQEILPAEEGQVLNLSSQVVQSALKKRKTVKKRIVFNEDNNMVMRDESISSKKSISLQQLREMLEEHKLKETKQKNEELVNKFDLEVDSVIPQSSPNFKGFQVSWRVYSRAHLGYLCIYYTKVHKPKPFVFNVSFSYRSPSRSYNHCRLNFADQPEYSLIKNLVNNNVTFNQCSQTMAAAIIKYEKCRIQSRKNQITVVLKHNRHHLITIRRQNGRLNAYLGKTTITVDVKWAQRKWLAKSEVEQSIIYQQRLYSNKRVELPQQLLDQILMLPNLSSHAIKQLVHGILQRLPITELKELVLRLLPKRITYLTKHAQDKVKQLVDQKRYFQAKASCQSKGQQLVLTLLKAVDGSAVQARQYQINRISISYKRRPIRVSRDRLVLQLDTADRSIKLLPLTHFCKSVLETGLRKDEQRDRRDLRIRLAVISCQRLALYYLKDRSQTQSWGCYLNFPTTFQDQRIGTISCRQGLSKLSSGQFVLVKVIRFTTKGGLQIVRINVKRFEKRASQYKLLLSGQDCRANQVNEEYAFRKGSLAVHRVKQIPKLVLSLDQTRILHNHVKQGSQKSLAKPSSQHRSSQRVFIEGGFSIILTMCVGLNFCTVTLYFPSLKKTFYQSVPEDGVAQVELKRGKPVLVLNGKKFNLLQLLVKVELQVGGDPCELAVFLQSPDKTLCSWRSLQLIESEHFQLLLRLENRTNKTFKLLKLNLEICLFYYFWSSGAGKDPYRFLFRPAALISCANCILSLAESLAVAANTDFMAQSRIAILKFVGERMLVQRPKMLICLYQLIKDAELVTLHPSLSTYFRTNQPPGDDLHPKEALVVNTLLFKTVSLHKGKKTFISVFRNASQKRVTFVIQDIATGGKRVLRQDQQLIHQVVPFFTQVSSISCKQVGKRSLARLRPALLNYINKLF